MRLQQFFKSGLSIFKQKSAPVNIHNHLSPGIVFRFCNATPESLQKNNGYAARGTVELLEERGIESLLNYQVTNEGQPGIPTSATLEAAQMNLNQNPDLSQRNLYGFFSKQCVSLTQLKYESGVQVYDGNGADLAAEFDDQLEVIVLGHVPLQNFLFSVDPNDTVSFFQGNEVANQMSLYLEVPKHISQDDMQNLATVYRWLQRNNCHAAADSLVKAHYEKYSVEKSKEIAVRVFSENPIELGKVLTLLDKQLSLDAESKQSALTL